MQKTTKSRFALFLAYSVAIVLTIMLFTAGPATWHAAGQIQPRYLFYALILSALMQYWEIQRLRILTRAMGTRITFAYALRAVLAYNFLASITPTLSGGEPLMIYMLKEKEVGVGQGTAIVAIRGILQLILIAVTGPIIIFFHHEFLPTTGHKVVFDIVAVCFLLAVIFLVYAFQQPQKAKNTLERIFHLLDRISYFKRHSSNWIKRVGDWIEEFNYSLKFFINQRKSSIFIAFIYTIIFLATNYLIAYFLLLGLNFPISVGKVIMVQIVLYFILYFSPTPGGSGIAEAGFYMLFFPMVPKHILGLLVILWRLFTTYIGVFLGGLVIMKKFGLEQVEKFAEEEVKPAKIS